jgi:hypothetical protein
MSKFVFIQYTGGAGGKAVSCCVQTADKVGSWWSQQPIPETLASFHTNNVNHVRREPDADYKLKWLARTYGIDRGDRLTKEEVEKFLREEKVLKDIIEDKKYIIVSWNKLHMPLWFEGELIQIITNESSLAWLADRRKKLFYVESDEGVIEVRYDSRYHPKPERNDRRISSLPIDELVIKQLKEETIIPSPSAHQIQLSWLLDQQWSQVFDMLENSINDRIDRVWCEQYMTAWHKKVF